MPAISDVKEEPWYLVPKDRFVYEIYSPPVHPDLRYMEQTDRLAVDVAIEV